MHYKSEFTFCDRRSVNMVYTEVRAIKRLEHLERKLSNDSKLREEYNKVMSEYLSMNHMRLVSKSELENSSRLSIFLTMLW